MNKTNFINSIKEGALIGQANYGILPSVIIAQAILESGWGDSELTERAKNLFGIKAFPDWKGKKITLPTTEWYNNVRTVVEADFRAYDSLNASIEDHNRLLSKSRYASLRGETDYKNACQKLLDSGYATDPEYAAKLISIIENNRLYEYDAVNKCSVDNKIIKFQRLCNRLSIKDSEGEALIEDSILGSRTMSCISKMPMLKIGSKGPAVEFVQEIVKAVPVDGDFGPITRKCVMEYQKGKAAQVDGIVGKETWTVMVTR